MSRPRLGPELSRAAALMQKGRLDEARTICRQVLKRNKRDLDGHQMLGLIESMGGRFERAAKHFRDGLEVNPQAPMLLAGLGKAYTSLGRYDDAVKTYDRALAAEPGYPPAIGGKADVLERLGRFDDARDLLAPVVEGGAANAEMAHTYATLLQRAGRDADAVALAEERLAAPDLGDITRRKLLYCAGKSYDVLGDCDRAFDAFRRANALLRRPFSISDVRRNFARIREVFAPGRRDDLARSSQETEVPIFVVSMPRSGSTLVEQILAAHPRVHGAGEIDELPARVRELSAETDGAGHPDSVPLMTRQIADRLAGRYLGRVRALHRGADRIVDKHLQNFQYLGLITRLFPRARIIFCHRDPMAVCFSCYMLPLSPIALPYTTDLRHLGQYHREYARLMDFWIETLGDALKVVSYEEIIADQAGVSRALVEFAGLEWDDACLRFYDSGRQVSTASYDQVRRPIYTDALKRYERYGAHLDPLRDALDHD